MCGEDRESFGEVDEASSCGSSDYPIRALDRCASSCRVRVTRHNNGFESGDHGLSADRRSLHIS